MSAASPIPARFLRAAVSALSSVYIQMPLADTGMKAARKTRKRFTINAKTVKHLKS
jgi:hypothetical protein